MSGHWRAGLSAPNLVGEVSEYMCEKKKENKKLIYL